MRYRKIFRKFAVLNGSIAVITLVLSGCAGPPVLGRQVVITSYSIHYTKLYDFVFDTKGLMADLSLKGAKFTKLNK